MRLIRRFHTPGTAPGTLAETAAPDIPIRLTVTRYDLDRLSVDELDTIEQLPSTSPDPVTWIDLEGHDPAAIQVLGDRLQLHPLLMEDLTNLGQRPKFEDYENTLFITTEHFFRDGHGAPLKQEQVGIVITGGGVVSVRESAGPLFDPVRKRLQGGRLRIRGGGPGYLAYALLDTVVDHLFVVLHDIGESLEALEDPLFEEPRREHLESLHSLKREILRLRKSVWPMRDMINAMIRDDSDILSEETRLYLRDVADHAARALDIVETYRDMLSSLMDLYLSSVSNRMNEVMKVLTIIATIFIPLSFVAGLYGMNFDPEVSPLNMPELGWYWGYPAAILVMASVAGAMLLFFRRRGWI